MEFRFYQIEPLKQACRDCHGQAINQYLDEVEAVFDLSLLEPRQNPRRSLKRRTLVFPFKGRYYAVGSLMWYDFKEDTYWYKNRKNFNPCIYEITERFYRSEPLAPYSTIPRVASDPKTEQTQTFLEWLCDWEELCDKQIKVLGDNYESWVEQAIRESPFIKPKDEKPKHENIDHTNSTAISLVAWLFIILGGSLAIFSLEDPAARPASAVMFYGGIGVELVKRFHELHG